MSETTYLKELVVVEDGIAYKFKGVSLSNSNASTILNNLISEYTEKYNNLNTQVTALENQLELGQVKFVTDMTTLNTEQLVNTLYVNDEVVGIVDDGSGIIPQVYLKDGSSVSLKEVERKEEDADDGNEYLGYVNKATIKYLSLTVGKHTHILHSNLFCYGFENDVINGDEPISFGEISVENAISCLHSTNGTTLDGRPFKITSFGPGLAWIGNFIPEACLVTITRLDTNMNVHIPISNPYEGASTSEILFSPEDLGKTIQLKIEVEVA